MSKHITFVCERLPVHDSSGAESYNLYVSELFAAIGFDIHLIITGDYSIPPIYIEQKASPTSIFSTIQYTQYEKFGSLLVSKSLKSYLRPFKRFYNKMTSSKKNSTNKTIKIARYITKSEAARALEFIHPESKLILFDTIFRHHQCFDSLHLAKVLVAHDIFCLRASSFESRGYIVEPRLNLEEESEIWQNFDILISINEDENNVVKRSGFQNAVTVFPAVQFWSNRDEYQTVKCENKILYIGANAHHNVEGLSHFLSSVWPSIIEVIPSAELIVAGNIFESFGDKKNTPGVTFVGRVSDLGGLAKTCSFAINPVYMGSGIKIKILDYLSFGLPCISTPIGVKGFPVAENMPIVAAQSDEEYVSLITDWLTSIESLKARSTQTDSYCKLFSRETTQSRLESCLEEIVYGD